ncbi:MAG: tetratricopeptide repeat protein, partial [Magnetococcales bacterium]|nr:tetratricopeptide repeat protein [Magnetococcales bacterium]
AVAAYDQALQRDPRNAQALNNRGNALKQLGRHTEAESDYRRAMAVSPRYAEPYRNLADLLRERQLFAEALNHAQQALRLNPDYADAQLVLAAVYRDQKRFKEAQDVLRHVLGRFPRLPEAHLAMGQLLQGMGAHAEALPCYRRAIRLNPDMPASYNHLAIALREEGQLDEAITILQQSVTRHPRVPGTLRNLGNLLKEACRIDEAKAALYQAVSLAPQDAQLRMELAFTLILNGELAAGAREYEWRHQAIDRLERNFPKPAWDGSDPRGKTILVYCEQGQGANIHYSRYLPLLAAHGARILLETYPSLKSLFATLPGPQHLFVRGQEKPGEYDLQASLLSMPHLFGSEVETVPVNLPLFAMDAEKVRHWRQRLHREGDRRLKVGIAWQGNANFGGDRHRSIPLRHFRPLLEVAGVRFISLQHGFGREQLVDLPEELMPEDWGGEVGDFVDTAALMESLDLVISSDTAVPHLAGSQGRPTWLVLPFCPDWRFMLGREDSPWYPGMRLFRQSAPGDWPEVMARVGEALRQRVE